MPFRGSRPSYLRPLTMPGLFVLSVPGVMAEPQLSAEASRAAITQALLDTAPLPPWALTLLYALGIMAFLGAVGCLCLARWRRERIALDASPVRYTPLETPVPSTKTLGQAQQARKVAPLAAVDLLYQGLLSRLATDYRLSWPPGTTETELLKLVRGLRLSGLEAFTHHLQDQWLRARYAGVAPDDAAWAQLCEGWRHLFPGDDPA